MQTFLLSVCKGCWCHIKSCANRAAMWSVAAGGMRIFRKGKINWLSEWINVWVIRLRRKNQTPLHKPRCICSFVKPDIVSLLRHISHIFLAQTRDTPDTQCATFLSSLFGYSLDRVELWPLMKKGLEYICLKMDSRLALEPAKNSGALSGFNNKAWSAPVK